MVLEEFYGWLGHHDVNAALNRVHCNGIMRRVRSKDCDRIAGLERINGRLVRVGIDLVIAGIRLEGNVHSIVDLGYVLLEVRACSSLAFSWFRRAIQLFVSDRRCFICDVMRDRRLLQV